MKYDIRMFYANGTSEKYNNCATMNIADGVLYFTDEQKQEHITTMPFLIIKRPSR